MSSFIVTELCGPQADSEESLPPQALTGISSLPYLGDDAQIGSVVQQRRCHVSVSLPGCQVQRCVSRAGGGVWVRSVCQELLDDVLFTQAA